MTTTHHELSYFDPENPFGETTKLAIRAVSRRDPRCVADCTPGVGPGSPTGTVRLWGEGPSEWFVTAPGSYRLTGGPQPHWDRGVVISGGRECMSAEWLPGEALRVVGEDRKVAGSISAANGATTLTLDRQRYRIVPTKGFIGGWHIFAKLTLTTNTRTPSQSVR